MRRLVNRGFTRKTVDRYEAAIRDLARSVVVEALEHDEFDFVTEIARQLPMRMLGRLLGVPDADAEQLVVWGDQLLSNTDPEYTDHVVDLTDTEEFRLIPFRSPAGLEVFRYAQEAAALRRTRPTDDVISRLLAPTSDGTPLTDLEFNNFFALLVAAGNDTTPLHRHGWPDGAAGASRGARGPAAGSVADPDRRGGDPALDHGHDALPPHRHARPSRWAAG